MGDIAASGNLFQPSPSCARYVAGPRPPFYPCRLSRRSQQLPHRGAGFGLDELLAARSGNLLEKVGRFATAIHQGSCSSTKDKGETEMPWPNPIVGSRLRSNGRDQRGGCFPATRSDGCEKAKMRKKGGCRLRAGTQGDLWRCRIGRLRRISRAASVDGMCSASWIV